MSTIADSIRARVANALKSSNQRREEAQRLEDFAVRFSQLVLAQDLTAVTMSADNYVEGWHADMAQHYADRWLFGEAGCQLERNPGLTAADLPVVFTRVRELLVQGYDPARHEPFPGLGASVRRVENFARTLAAGYLNQDRERMPDPTLSGLWSADAPDRAANFASYWLESRGTSDISDARSLTVQERSRVRERLMELLEEGYDPARHEPTAEMVERARRIEDFATDFANTCLSQGWREMVSNGWGVVPANTPDRFADFFMQDELSLAVPYEVRCLGVPAADLPAVHARVRELLGQGYDPQVHAIPEDEDEAQERRDIENGTGPAFR